MIKLSEETDLRPLLVKTRDQLVYCHNVEAEPDGKPWYHDIRMFLKDGIYFESTNSADKRTLRKLAYISS